MGGGEGRHVRADLRRDGEGRAHPDGGDGGEAGAHHPAQRLRRRPLPGGHAAWGGTAGLRRGAARGRIRRAAVRAPVFGARSVDRLRDPRPAGPDLPGEQVEALQRLLQRERAPVAPGALQRVRDPRPIRPDAPVAERRGPGRIALSRRRSPAGSPGRWRR